MWACFCPQGCLHLGAEVHLEGRSLHKAIMVQASGKAARIEASACSFSARFAEAEEGAPAQLSGCTFRMPVLQSCMLVVGGFHARMAQTQRIKHARLRSMHMCM